MDNCWGKDSNGECYTSSSQTGYQGFLNFHDPSGSSTVSSTCDTFQGLSASLPVVSQLQKSTLVGTSAYSVVPVSSSNLSYSTAVPTATFNSASGLLNSSSNNQLTGFQATYSGHSTAMNPVQQHDFLGVTPFVYTQPGQVSDNQYSSTPVPSSSVTTRGPGRQLPSTNICSTSTPFTPLQPNHFPIHTPKACSIQDILMSFSIPLPASSTTVACTPSSLPLSNSILSSQAQIQTSSFLNQSSVNSQLQVSLSSAPFNSCSTMPVTPSSTVISVSQPNFSGVQPFVYPQPGQVSDQYLSTSTPTKITTRLPVRQQPGTASFCSTSTPFTPLQQSHPPIYSPNAFLSQGDLISYSSPQPVSNKTIVCTLSPTLNPTLSPSVCSSTPKIHITPFLNNFPVNNQVQAVSSASFNSYSTVYSSGGGTGDLGQGSHLSTQIGMPTLRAQTSSNTDLSRKDNLSEDKGDSNNCSKKLSSVCSQDVVYLGEVQKPELNDKSEEVIFVRKNYNRSGLVCLTPNKKIRRQKSSTYTKRVSSDDSKTEVNITISRTKSSDETALPTSEWSYQTKSGLETFDPKTTSLLELLFHTGSDSNIILTLPGKADKYAVNMDTLKMTNNRSGEELLLYRKPIELLQDVADDLIPSCSSGVSEFPSHWLPQENDIELVGITRTFNNDEWMTIENLMRKTLPGLHINTIERVQNKKLWIRYAFQKAMLIDKNGFEADVNEKLLFHGTRSNPPCKIWQSEDGFDMRYCNSGVWGLGTYFAEAAAYSHDYAHTPLPYSSLRQMFVANVLTGHSKEMLSDRTLRRPPVRIPATSTDPEVLYDSVTGMIYGKVVTRIYVLYKFDMAYPSYLVTYSA